MVCTSADYTKSQQTRHLVKEEKEHCKWEEPVPQMAQKGGLKDEGYGKMEVGV